MVGPWIYISLHPSPNDGDGGGQPGHSFFAKKKGNVLQIQLGTQKREF